VLYSVDNSNKNCPQFVKNIINKISFNRTPSLSNAEFFKRDSNVCACPVSALILLMIVTVSPAMYAASYNYLNSVHRFSYKDTVISGARHHFRRLLWKCLRMCSKCITFTFDNTFVTGNGFSDPDFYFYVFDIASHLANFHCTCAVSVILLLQVYKHTAYLTIVSARMQWLY